VTRKEAERKLRQVVEPLLERHGFKRSRGLVFLRPQEDRTDRIGFSTFKDRSGIVRASFGVGIRLLKIEACRSDKQDEDAPSIGMPIHLLQPRRSYFDWQLTSETDWMALSAAIALEIEVLALPFLKTYGNLDAVKTALESDEPRLWFTCDNTQRVELLALIDCAQGDIAKAIERLDRALMELRAASAKERRPLEQLRNHLHRTIDE
jgi:hypothetical protein